MSFNNNLKNFNEIYNLQMFLQSRQSQQQNFENSFSCFASTSILNKQTLNIFQPTKSLFFPFHLTGTVKTSIKQQQQFNQTAEILPLFQKSSICSNYLKGTFSKKEILKSKKKFNIVEDISQKSKNLSITDSKIWLPEKFNGNVYFFF